MDVLRAFRALQRTHEGGMVGVQSRIESPLDASLTSKLQARHLPQEDAINPRAELLLGLHDELDELKQNVRARNWGLGCFVLAGTLFFGVSESGGAALAGITGLLVLGVGLAWLELRRLRRMRMIRRLIRPDAEDRTLSPSSPPNQSETA